MKVKVTFEKTEFILPLVLLITLLMALGIAVYKAKQTQLAHRNSLNKQNELKYLGPGKPLSRINGTSVTRPKEIHRQAFPDPEAQLKAQIGEDMYRTLQQMQSETKLHGPNNHRKTIHEQAGFDYTEFL